MIGRAVDFGSWVPDDEERSDVEYWARRLPADWRVRLSSGDEDTGSFFAVVEDAAGQERARGSFGYEAFHDVARFVEKIVAQGGREVA
ncbi:MAG TPA: hypothetical protein VIC87_18650 [Vicinamibacteria bacterium]|jgi:hypothetical protein